MTATNPAAPPRSSWRQRLVALPRSRKRILLVLFDLALLLFIVWAANAIRFGRLFVPDSFTMSGLLLLAPILTVIVFWQFSLYRSVTRFMGSGAFMRIASAVVLSVLVWALIVFMLGQAGVPRSVILIYGIMAIIAVNTSRQIIGNVLYASEAGKAAKAMGSAERTNVLLYGAGSDIAQIIRDLRETANRDVVAIVDNDETIWGQYVSGIKVYRPDKIAHIISRAEIDEVILAETSQTSGGRSRRKVLRALESLSVSVTVLPSVQDIATGRFAVSDLRALNIDDLLGRSPVPPNENLLRSAIANKAVLVTGAGGSVGSELVRQILAQSPARLVLFDHSEFALYQIEADVRARLAVASPGERKPEIVSVLGSVRDAALVAETLKSHSIAIIYHAAAYKHVPIVEANPYAGLENNTFGCATIADAALAAGVERFVLISTDKAVRPTNVMGATKRLAEMYLQVLAERNPATIFTMVRFGNVLGSSGSVTGLFRKQIEAGGPVTVTHPKVTRYFMSLPEAACLVIQASAMAKGGDVFVLDMGEPVLIAEFARLMVQLAGRDVRTPENPNGDIEIIYTGLRPGEKLYEELLIGGKTSGTEHPRIMRLDEAGLPEATLHDHFDALKIAIAARDRSTIETILRTTVEGYQPMGAEPPKAVEKHAWTADSQMLH